MVVYISWSTDFVYIFSSHLPRSRYDSVVIVCSEGDQFLALPLTLQGKCQLFH